MSKFNRVLRASGQGVPACRAQFRILEAGILAAASQAGPCHELAGSVDAPYLI